MSTCPVMVSTGQYSRFYQKVIEVQCGTQHGEQGVLLCPTHKAEAKIAYPQGWDFYPGDTCKHGRYVGGVGIDHICGLCEEGD